MSAVACSENTLSCKTFPSHFFKNNFLPREVDGKNKVDMLTFHGCEKDMAGAMGSNIEVRNAKFVLVYDH